MTDNVNHPSHYAEGWSNGSEVIDITENLNFNRGNAVKYIARAGKKNPDAEVEDLEKAQWYLGRELERLNKMLKPEARWTLDEVRKLREQLWDNRVQRVWDLLDNVPPSTIVADIDGDLYRRISGTGQFQIGFLYEDEEEPLWEELQPDLYNKYGPYTEVST